MKKQNNKTANKNLGGRPTKYDASKHLTLLENVFKRGEDISAFCSEANISRSTFFEWVNTNSEFREKYKVVINHSQRKWESYPLNSKNFNFGYWASMMKNRYKWGYCRMPKLKGTESPLELINLALKLYTEGELSDTQLEKLMTLANNKVKIIEHDTFEKRISKIEAAYGAGQ